MESFKDSLRSFLDVGTDILRRHIPPLLSKLEALHEVISQLNNCRFYASSLLIYYDAADPAPINIKMIDFAHSLVNSHLLKPLGEIKEGCINVPYPPTSEGPDLGYLKGLKSLIQAFTEILNEQTHVV